MGKRLTFILGGARSGKSTYAEQLARAGGSVLFVATAEAGDAEMAARIAAHQRNRPEAWDTLEEPLDLAQQIAAQQRHYDKILVDCLTLWLSNLMHRNSADGRAAVDIRSEAQRLLECYREGEASWILVSNEVGLSLVPTTALGRAFRDELGLLNQVIAAAADEVVLMIAGLPVDLKRLAPLGTR